MTIIGRLVEEIGNPKTRGTIIAFSWVKDELVFAIEFDQEIYMRYATECRFVQTEQQHRESWDGYVRAMVARRELT